MTCSSCWIFRQACTPNEAHVATPYEDGNNKQTDVATPDVVVDDDDDSIDDDDHRDDDVGDHGGNAIKIVFSIRFVAFASHFASFRSSDRLIRKHFTGRRKRNVIEAYWSRKVYATRRGTCLYGKNLCMAPVCGCIAWDLSCIAWCLSIIQNSQVCANAHFASLLSVRANTVFRNIKTFALKRLVPLWRILYIWENSISYA